MARGIPLDELVAKILQTCCKHVMSTDKFVSSSDARYQKYTAILNVTGLYTVFFLNTAVYRLAILMISTLLTKHNLLRFVHRRIFVIKRLKFDNACIDTCLATSDYVHHCIIGSPISKCKEKNKQLEVQLFHLPVSRYFLTVYYRRHFLIPRIT